MLMEHGISSDSARKTINNARRANRLNRKSLVDAKKVFKFYEFEMISAKKRLHELE